MRIIALAYAVINGIISIIVPLLFVNILYKYARLIFVRFGIINNVDLNWE